MREKQITVKDSVLAADSVNARSWMIVALLCVAQFVGVLNFQIVTLVLPAIQRDLKFSTENLQWVVGANSLAFGSGLLIAGRLADLFGRRRMFLSGMGLFALTSLLCGLSQSQLLLIIARAGQGLGTAIMTPAALALLIDTFREGTYRNRAFGIWGAVGPLGGIIGTLLGSVLADRFGWPWVFFLNIPIAVGALIMASCLLIRDHDIASQGKFDIAGAITSVCSVVLLIEGLTQVTHSAGISLTALALLAAAAILLFIFCLFEVHASHPLVPLGFFLRSNIAGANLATFAFAATANTPIFFFALYMQQVRGFSSFVTGLTFLPTNLMIIAGAFCGTRLTNWLGHKRTILIGMCTLIIAALLFTRMSVNSEYIWTLLPALLLMGGGLGITQVAATIAGTEQVAVTERGLASSLLNMSAQLGTTIGLAILVSIASIRTSMLTAGTQPSPQALVAGFQWAFYGGTVIAVLGTLIVLFTVHKDTERLP